MCRVGGEWDEDPVSGSGGEVRKGMKTLVRVVGGGVTFLCLHQPRFVAIRAILIFILYNYGKKNEFGDAADCTSIEAQTHP